MVSSDRLLVAGTVVGLRYRIVRLLGRGGMGEVYEAVHEPLARRVAVKTIRSEVAADPAVLARFRREAETAASLGHPNIVQVTDFQALPGEPALLVMEHLEGRPLSDVIDEERKIEPGRAAFIAMQILSGLAAAHRAGIVHRDIKPANVFLLSTLAVRDLVKIVDFGIAKMVVDVAATSQRKLTDFGQVLGTFAYMAPEQAMGVDVDARADLFAVGATLFHALSGFLPTEAMVPGKPRVPLRDVAPWIDPALAIIVDRAMERLPANRFASAQEMADALAPFAQDVEPSPASATIVDGGVRALIEARFAAETKGDDEPIPDTVVFGGTQPLPPMRISNAPSTPDPRMTPPPPTPAVISPRSAPPPSSVPASVSSASWLPWAFAALFAAGLVVALVVGYGHVLPGRAAPGSRASTEQAWLASAKLPPCPSPETCTSHREGPVTYPVCTKTAPFGTLAPRDFVLVGAGDGAYVGVVARPSEDAVHYAVEGLVVQTPADVTVDDLRRLCDRSAKRNLR